MLDGVLSIARDGTQKLEEQTKIQAKIQSMLEHQQNIMEDVYRDLGDFKEIQKRLDEVDELNNVIDINIQNHRKFLTDLLNKQPKSQNSQISDLIASLILNIQDAVIEMGFAHTEKGEYEVEISELLTIEDDIKSTIDSLTEKGLYLESSDDRLLRQQKYQRHIKKLYDFIQEEAKK
ncbi:hypothetical protein TVAG_355100 [Trichomonas vaginalis G3]|uniref:Uncharacterized protein n=1 Tax=Trichomonas vaginalis (strain ATCC PRA-98 / G3) TaxID=412133 RepID=A2EFZ5_TRIV3|nr:hypothetical protein TVAGG3_0515870 [Trichomonas vaginalis G3]EAY08451.1 hypothetical protein TVAG_355100 [Trichomonas vaginalis G3]KAI5518117.1 hypothetical protein TVAGG3_0515870 [Trichomonas vaginalis G3]|eukprot:XP_001320674.1 hypothetical protein [Trichomonas vaginalis G3]